MAKFDIDDDVKVTMGVEVSIGEYAPRGTVSITENGTYNVGGYKYADVDVEPEPQPLQSKTATPTESTQSIVPDENYYGLSEVTVNGISSTYVGTGIARNDSSNLTAIGSVVSGPSGYYSQAFSKAVNIGNIRQNGWSESVSGSNLNMYPNLVFSSGYISSSPSIERLFNVIEKTVTPSTSQIIVQRENANQWLSKITIDPIPSEYIVPSGTLNITSGGTKDVTNYAYVSVPNGTAGQPYVMTEFRSNHTAVITPLVTNTACYISGSTKMGNTLTVSASELASGTYNITSNGIYDVTNYASASVSVSGGGGDYTIDDLAMHPISGSISGSASYISDYAFNNWINLTDVSFSNATSIGSYAFNSCTRIASINFTSATYIGSSAFYNCYSIMSINFPNVTSVGGFAFGYCSALTSVAFPKLTSLGAGMFYTCRNLSSLDGFPSATTIGTSAFYSCQGLTSASHSGITKINADAFRNCYHLSEIDFPNTTTIGDSAFYNCSLLTSVDFPAASIIGNYAFRTCSALTSISFPNATSLYTGAFYSCPGLTTVDLSKILDVGQQAFMYCGNLTSATFQAATSIGGSAFYNCSNLVSISIPCVTKIEGNAFQNCRNLATIVLPSLQSIVYSAFQGCYRLFSVYLLAKSRCSLAYLNIFNSTPISSYTEYTSGVNGSIFVPASLYDSYVYASDTWSYFSSRFVSLTDSEIEALLNE